MSEALLYHMHLKYRTSKMGSLQGYVASGSLKTPLHRLSAPAVFAWLAWCLPRLSQWSLCLPAWRKFSLVAARLKRCLSCIYPLFIWRTSSAFSVWGGIVSWLLRSVLKATAGVFFLAVLVVGCLHFCTSTSVRKGVQTAKKKGKIGWICRRTLLWCFAFVFFFYPHGFKKNVHVF